MQVRRHYCLENKGLKRGGRSSSGDLESESMLAMRRKISGLGQEKHSFHYQELNRTMKFSPATKLTFEKLASLRLIKSSSFHHSPSFAKY
jgi:dimeric dUTPase (all-alpha-NTP-PPase superfamily)